MCYSQPNSRAMRWEDIHCPGDEEREGERYDVHERDGAHAVTL